MTLLPEDFEALIEVIFKAVMQVGTTHNVEQGLLIRDEIRRLPNPIVTEILNQIILRLVLIDPELCRWFVIDVFLNDSDPEAKADVAERINVLIADLP